MDKRLSELDPLEDELELEDLFYAVRETETPNVFEGFYGEGKQIKGRCLQRLVVPFITTSDGDTPVSTTSASYVNVEDTVTITPKSDASTIIAHAYIGDVLVHRVSGSISLRRGLLRLFDVTNTTALAELRIGRNDAASTANLYLWAGGLVLRGTIENTGLTPITIALQMAVQDSGAQLSIFGASVDRPNSMKHYVVEEWI